MAGLGRVQRAKQAAYDAVSTRAKRVSLPQDPAPGAGDERRRFRLRRRVRRERVVAVLPSLLTLGNAVCGFGSITYAAKVGPEAVGNPLFIAGLLIFLAMVFDMLDGHAARLTKQTSDFGAQLDSLCDVISFGVAPAFLMLQFPQMYHPRLLWVVAVWFILCAVLRLARFNVETGDEDSHDTFSGLPSPAAAAMVASCAIALPGLVMMTDPGLSELTQRAGRIMLGGLHYGLPVLTLALACLMVSRIRYPHVFNRLFRGRRDFRQLVQLIFALVAIFLVHELAVPLIVGYFVLAAPAVVLWKWAVSGRSQSPEAPADAPREAIEAASDAAADGGAEQKPTDESGV